MSNYVPPATCQIPEIDRIYREIFGFKTTGTFVEIGAYDGESCSNTSFLADLGWRGVYVEPVTEYAAICAKRHRANAVKVVNVAIGPEFGQKELSIGGVLSSLDPRHIEAFRTIEWAKGYHKDVRRQVKVITPQDLFDFFAIRDFDLLVIDVEGYEWPIVEAIDFAIYRPTVAIIEVRDEDPQFSSEVRQDSVHVIEKLKASGYRIHWRDHGNVVFVREMDGTPG
jgi:FkbM family methyltransferase